MWLNKHEMQEWTWDQCDEHPELRNELKHLITLPFFALRYCQKIENDPVVRRKINIRCLAEWIDLDLSCPFLRFTYLKYSPNILACITLLLIVIISTPISIVLWLWTNIEEMYLDYKLKD